MKQKIKMLLFEIQNLTMANKMLNSLPADVLKDIHTFILIHPIAELVKQLQFELLPPVVEDEFTYCPAQLTISCPHDNYFLLHHCDEVIYKSNICCFILEDFGDAEYDVYKIQSDYRSDIELGRVFGTDRWGHDLDENRTDFEDWVSREAAFSGTF